MTQYTAIDEDDITTIINNYTVKPYTQDYNNKEIMNRLLEKSFLNFSNKYLKQVDERHKKRVIITFIKHKDLIKNTIYNHWVYNLLVNIESDFKIRKKMGYNSLFNISTIKPPDEIYDYKNDKLRYTAKEYLKIYRENLKRTTEIIGMLIRGFSEENIKDKFGSANNVRVPFVGFKGNNKILCIVEEIYKPIKKSKTKYTLKVHYNKSKTALENFLSDYNVRVTKDYDII